MPDNLVAKMEIPGNRGNVMKNRVKLVPAILLTAAIFTTPYPAAADEKHGSAVAVPQSSRRWAKSRKKLHARN
jgi:hypothetical protein